MGKRAAEVELFVGNMSSIQREETAFYAKRGNMRLALLKVVSCGYGVAVEGLRRDRLLFGLYLKD
jgi:hypothetical protein